jgi:serine/threonine protein kinase/Tfp pilus assembly protein PilF
MASPEKALPLGANLCEQLASGDGANELVTELRALWNKGERVTTRELLASQSEFAPETQIVADLLYEEWCLWKEAGEPRDWRTLAEQFPGLEATLADTVGAHSFWERTSSFTPNGDTLFWPRSGAPCLGFMLEREMGRGAFSRVFLAREPALGHRRVVVKVSWHGSHEAETAGPLAHPNIVPIFSVQHDPDTRFTVVCMPYLGSATLADLAARASVAGPAARLRRGAILDLIQSLSAPDLVSDEAARCDSRLRGSNYADSIVHVAAQLAEAVAFIHARGIYHRDLKPSNVLLTPAGKPLLLDFNLSRTDRNGDARGGGTVPYMSPEQLRVVDDPKSALSVVIDARTDIFSLGVILYELLAGAHPFGPMPRGMSDDLLAVELLERQREGIGPRETLPVPVDPSLRRLIDRCLEFEPSQRPSARELSVELRKYLSSRRGILRWIRGHRWAGSAAALVLCAAGALGAYEWSIREPYALQQLNAAQRALKSQDYKGAVKLFERVLEVESESATALFGRGLAHERMGETHLAHEDFHSAGDLVQDGESLAHIGYFFNRRHLNLEAIRYYQKALAAGFDSGAVYNNLGFSHTQRCEYDKAQANLDIAVGRGPDFQAAYHNRMCLKFHLAFAQAGSGGRGVSDARREALVREALADAALAERLGPPFRELIFDTACLYALAAASDAAWISPAVEKLAEAVQQGKDPNVLNYLLFNSIRSDRRFQALLHTPSHPSPDQPTRRLVDPAPTEERDR